MGILSLFAETTESGPNIHIAPGAVAEVGGVTITNSILYGWIAALFIVVFLLLVARQVTVRPKGGVVQFVEIGVDFITNLVEGAFDNAKIGRRFVPFFVTLFFFILLSNWLGLLPLVGEGFKSGEAPLFRPFTGDLSGTLAIGSVTMVLVYIASIRAFGGFRNYIGHFFGGGSNPFFFFIGFLEIFTDLTRVLSLSLRLFLNITIGEIIIGVFAYLGHNAAPFTALPFFMIEIFVAGLQAYIFTILGTMYLAIAVNAAGEHAADSAGNEETFGSMEAKPSRVGSG